MCRYVCVQMRVYYPSLCVCVSLDRTPGILERLLLTDLMPLLDMTHVADTLPQVCVCVCVSKQMLSVSVCIYKYVINVCVGPHSPRCVSQDRFPHQKSPLSLSLSLRWLSFTIMGRLIPAVRMSDNTQRNKKHNLTNEKFKSFDFSGSYGGDQTPFTSNNL